MKNNVENPEHYTGKVQPIDLIEAQDLDFHEGSIVKYVSRWKKKNGIEDLKKAKWYLERLIDIELDKEYHADQADHYIKNQAENGN
jgi:hypothetical protein